MAELPTFRESRRFSDLEKLALEYAEAMTRTPAEVPEELFRSLAARLTPRQMVEMTSAVALENFSARFNNAFGIGPKVKS